MRFVIDEQLPPALAVQLWGDGYDAIHVIDMGLAGAPDDQVRSEAARRGAVLVSKDADFATLAPGGPAILWVRLGNVSNLALWSVLKPRLLEIIAAFEAGEMLVEIVRGD